MSGTIARAAALAAVLALAGAAQAADPPKGYLSAAERPDGAALVGPPPAPGTPEWEADGEAFRATRALQGSPRWARAQADNDYSAKASLAGFACAIGAAVTPETAPRTTALIERAVQDSVEVVRAAKKAFDRQRPFVPTTAPICIAREADLSRSASYPSGHAAQGWMYALILTQLAPDRATPLLARGRAFGDSRYVCGVHWKSDVEAARTAAVATFVVLQANPAYRAEVEAARAELSGLRARAAGPAGDCAAQTAADQMP